MAISQPTDIHAVVEKAFNAKDLDGLLSLYEKDALMGTMDGSVAAGLDAISEQWQAFLALDGHMTVKTRFVLEMSDVALLRNDWTFTSAGGDFSSSTSEVARKQADGSWLYAIDHPFGAGEMIP